MHHVRLTRLHLYPIRNVFIAVRRLSVSARAEGVCVCVCSAAGRVNPHRHRAGPRPAAAGLHDAQGHGGHLLPVPARVRDRYEDGGALYVGQLTVTGVDDRPTRFFRNPMGADRLQPWKDPSGVYTHKTRPSFPLFFSPNVGAHAAVASPSAGGRRAHPRGKTRVGWLEEEACDGDETGVGARERERGRREGGKA
jgi:hypothetical protein